MNSERYGQVAAGLAEVMVRLDVSDADRDEILSDPHRLSTSISVASNLLRTAYKSGEKVGVEIIAEARELFGDEAANQLLAKLGTKYSNIK